MGLLRLNFRAFELILSFSVVGGVKLSALGKVAELTAQLLMNFPASESQRVALQARCRDLAQKNAAPLSPPRHEARAGQRFRP